MLARMGGIRLVNADGTKQPHATFSLCELPDDTELPTKEEIYDKSKGDYVAKAITIVQTLWFAIQAAHRVSQGFIVTELELTTFAHAVLNIFVYWCWWNKPLNIRFPIYVSPRRHAVEGQDGAPTENKGGEGNASTEKGDTEAQISAARPLPIRVRIGASLDRYALKELPTSSVWVNVLYWAIGGMFGAIHCMAWNSTFPSGIEHLLWRICAPLVTVLPGVIIGFSVLAVRFDLSDGTTGFIDLLAMVAYSFARICLLILALVALRALPFRAYETSTWSAFVPHIG